MHATPLQQDIKMHGFANATSSHYKKDNWAQIQRFCEKQVRGAAGDGVSCMHALDLCLMHSGAHLGVCGCCGVFSGVKAWHTYTHACGDACGASLACGSCVHKHTHTHTHTALTSHGMAQAQHTHTHTHTTHALRSQSLPLPRDLVEGTAAGVHGAATALLEHLFELFTGKKVQRAVVLPGQAATGLMRDSSYGSADGMGQEANASRNINTQLKAGAAIEFGAVGGAHIPHIHVRCHAAFHSC